MKINEWPRHGIQALWAFITNSHVTGFVTGKIYTGKLKNACVPGLNCYPCPGAVGACPIGSLQAVIGSWNFKMAYYVVGFLIFIGAMVGRLICGFLCPFGLIQDLLNKIPFPKKIRTFKAAWPSRTISFSCRTPMWRSRHSSRRARLLHPPSIPSP